MGAPADQLDAWPPVTSVSPERVPERSLRPIASMLRTGCKVLFPFA